MSDSASLVAQRRQFAIEVIERLRSFGYQALFAGGCVRDLLMGREPSDFDVATDARPEEILPMFRRVCEVGAVFGVVRVVGPPGVGEVEVATFRSDGAYLDGRRPESVVFSSLEEDAARRDFTINGMFYDPIQETVIDHVGGRADLDAKVIRAIGDPFARFREDKLRLLRAARFAARFGFSIETETWSALRAMAPEVGVVSVERIAQELEKMLTHPSRGKGYGLVRDAGLLDAILPMSARVAELEGSWERTLRILAALPERVDFATALAAAWIDWGRIETRRIGETGAVEYPGHAGCAARLARLGGRTLRLSNETIARTSRLLEFQEVLWTAPELSDAQLKRLLIIDEIDDLFTLHRAEAWAADRDPAPLDWAERYRIEQPRGPLDPPPLLTGHDLKQAGLRPGPRFAEWLDAVRTAQLDGAIATREEAMALVERLRVE
jgi:poly(A) polymerase